MTEFERSYNIGYADGVKAEKEKSKACALVLTARVAELETTLSGPVVAYLVPQDQPQDQHSRMKRYVDAADFGGDARTLADHAEANGWTPLVSGAALLSKGD